MDQIGRYRTERVLGSGAFATVWLAHDDTLGLDVAIKVLADNWANDQDVRRRFLEEARILFRANSPHIVRIHHVDELPDGRPYFVMTYADLGTLEDRMRERAVARRAFSVDEARKTSLDIAAGLADAHALGVVHRDLKPSAILFYSAPGERPGETVERLVLGDFGIAKDIARSRGTTVATGTPHYMAPEQAEGHVDERTDIYSAAVILYEMLAGRVPYPFDSLRDVVRAQASAPPARISALRPDVPAALATAIDTALSPDPARRFRTAADWATALRGEQPAGTTPVPETTPGVGEAAAAAAAGATMAATMGPEEFRAAMAGTGEPQAGPSGPAVPPGPTGPPQTGGPPSGPPSGPPGGPPSGPPGGPPTSSFPTPEPRKRRKRSIALPLVGVVVVLGAIVGGVLLFTGGDADTPDITEVFAEPISSVFSAPQFSPELEGVEAFAPSVVPTAAEIPAGDDGTIRRIVDLLNTPLGELPPIEIPPPVDFPTPPTTTGPGETTTTAPVTNIAGSAPGLYGGTEVLNSCNTAALVSFFAENAEKAKAWAEVQGIDVEEIPDFIASLTDVILQADTRVINHGFRNGRANPINSVLQAGTAVLVDTFGVPRVRCYCGNPLKPAIELSASVTVRGTTWPGFELARTVVVSAVDEVTDFTITDIISRLPFVKGAGSPIVPTTPTTTTTTTTTTTVPATTTTVVLGTGDVQVTLYWNGDGDLDLHVIDPTGVEIYYEAPASASGGQLDVDVAPDYQSDEDCVLTPGDHFENVFWPEGGAPSGTYQAFVVYYDGSCGGANAYQLDMKIDGQVVASDSGTLSPAEASTPISITRP